MNATLGTVPWLFEECLTDHWALLDRGAHLKARLTVTRAIQLRKKDTFGAADAYAVFFFNGLRIGETDVVSPSRWPLLSLPFPLHGFFVESLPSVLSRRLL